MRIKRITLKNLFSFQGKQEIIFKENTLILAENGFGKTSLLNAIKLGLGQKHFKLDSILNNRANDKECFIEIDFSIFILKRIWDFRENTESFSIYLDNTLLKNDEAEEYLKEKFPPELIDFIFFDGEVEKDLLFLNSNKIKKIFEYTFDLDIFSNMIVDSKKVANKISHAIGDKEVLAFINLQEREDIVSQEILEKENHKVTLIKEIKNINELIRRNDLKIRHRSKEFEDIEIQIEKNSTILSKEITVFQEISLYQLPLLLNQSLLAQINDKESQSIDILDKKEFEKNFDTFINVLDSTISKDIILKQFYQIFNVNKNIVLTFNIETLRKIIINIKDSIEKKEKLIFILKEIKEKLLHNNELKGFEEEVEVLAKQKEIKEKDLFTTEEDLEILTLEYKELNKKLRLEFIAKREKYTNIKAVEELYTISDIAKKLYTKKLEKNLQEFNKLFAHKMEAFLALYQHINTIYINEKFNIVIEDESTKTLDSNLLSAGQKQILSFILINTILEFKQFIDFIFIDTPFGRLSNKNRDFIFNTYYSKFSELTLLVTSSEYDYLCDKDIAFKEYTISKNNFGSSIGVRTND